MHTLLTAAFHITKLVFSSACEVWEEIKSLHKKMKDHLFSFQVMGELKAPENFITSSGVAIYSAPKSPCVLTGCILINYDVLCSVRFCTNTRARQRWRFWTKRSRQYACHCRKTTIMWCWRLGPGEMEVTVQPTRLSCPKTQVRTNDGSRGNSRFLNWLCWKSGFLLLCEELKNILYIVMIQ